MRLQKPKFVACAFAGVMAQLISRPTTPGFGAPGYGAVRTAVVESNRVAAATGPYGRRGVSPVKTAPAPAPVFFGS